MENQDNNYMDIILCGLKRKRMYNKILFFDTFEALKPITKE